MKRNMLSIIILALMIVNVALTGIMMFSVTGTMKKTAKLIDGISSALALEIGNEQMASGDGETEVADVSMKDIATYKIEDEIVVPLTIGADGKQHYCQLSISLAMNTKDKDYKTYGEKVADSEDLIRGEVISIIGSYTIEEAQTDTDALRREILAKIQEMYDSKFIYNVVFREIVFQ